jgi:hypothetical protein
MLTLHFVQWLLVIQVRSLVVTGCSSWTLYASPNYQVSLFLDKICFSMTNISANTKPKSERLER